MRLGERSINGASVSAIVGEWRPQGKTPTVIEAAAQETN